MCSKSRMQLAMSPKLMPTALLGLSLRSTTSTGKSLLSPSAMTEAT